MTSSSTRPSSAPQRILISGASGFIGTALRRRLEEEGHTVLRLVRGTPQGPDEFNWAPNARMLDHGLIDTVDAVINLSGSPLGQLPWTPGRKRRMLDSRVQATRTLAEAMSMAGAPPKTFLSASAVGFYGDRPAERLDEDSARGEGFLADVVEAWEGATVIAPEKTRTVTFRTGLVFGPEGGAVGPLIPLTKLGLASRLGTGGQHWPWISLHDEIEAILHLLLHSELDGPVNLVGPTPSTADRITRRLARDLHRPYALRVPEAIIDLALQDARELLLSSQKVMPKRLLEDGFVFRHETAEDAVDALASELR